MQIKHSYRGGFALPTVLIASVVMLTVLAASVSSVVSVRNSLKVQYYEQLAKVAGEAGVAYAKACLAKNGNVPLWTDDKPLTPATDCAGNLLLSPAVDVLVVAGGGGGGAGVGGGGGGGGVVLQESIPVAAGDAITVTVGGGGAGGLSKSSGSNGANSRFGDVEAQGGGGGGGRASGTVFTPAGDGGSGGGGNGTYDSGTGTGAPGGAGAVGEGNDGGMGSAGSVSPWAGNGGGGGGAGGPGGNSSGLAINEGVSGSGGVGLLSDLSGQQVYYGAGGAGGRYSTGGVGAPGLSGGGTGGCCDASTGGAGQANTGGGGGGGSSGDGLGGAGGSGIVIVRYGYTSASPSITATGGSRYDSGPYRIHRFISSSTFTVTGVGTASCPTDPRCSVMVNGNLRSSFKVLSPSVDENGRAISLPNSGYVELLRESNGQVWRTYRQPSTQVATVPELCSGAASSQLGWNNAIRASTQNSLPGITTAQTITLANEPLNAGRMYYRKDFNVNQAGVYDVIGHSPAAEDTVELYVDGTLVTSVQNSTQTNSISLSAGCHVITAKVTNRTLLPRPSRFTAAVRQANAQPVVETDSTWRVSTGATAHFSQADFYADPSIWVNVTDVELANAVITSWGSASGDPYSRLISPSCASTCPPSSSTYFRDGRDFVVADNTEVLVSALCDDDCTVYVDGNPVIGGSIWSSINQQTLTLTAGSHNIGVRLYNSGSAANPSKFAVAVYNKANGEVLSRSNIHWKTANNQWVSGTNVDNDPMSYEDSFRPSPAEIADPVVADVLIVGGGGGGGYNSGGGGGGGGVVYLEDLAMTTGSKTVTIGSGGSAGASSIAGTRGGNSAFWGTVAQGGGGGASRDGGTAPTTGGSGGGGAGPTSSGTARYLGANLSVSGQGGIGGNGTAPDASSGAKGGGGGGAGGAAGDATTTVAGAGGPGYLAYITGTRMPVAGGGGGGTTASNGTPGIATDGGTAMGGGAAAANSGGGGGGGGGAPGSGGSGLVVIRFRTGTMSSITASGSYTISYATIKGIPYTIYRYTSSGTFNPGVLTPYL